VGWLACSSRSTAVRQECHLCNSVTVGAGVACASIGIVTTKGVDHLKGGGRFGWFSRMVSVVDA
jgi:hypothetical protein